MRKYIAMIITALLLLGTLTACSEDLPAPDAIFETIEAAEDVRVEMVINYDDIQTSTTIIEEDGARTHVYMETASFGAKSGDEYYSEIVDGVRWFYTENSDGTWKKEKLHELITLTSSSGFAGFFDSSLYYEEEGGYKMYKTASVDLDTMTFKDIAIEIAEDGSYRLTAVVTQTIDDLEVYGGATIIISLDDVTVTLPEA